MPTTSSRTDDPFELDRFVAAQEAIYSQALDEIQRGQKRSHWMWFILPQIAGLGSSAMAQRYAIQNIAEAAAYLKHPILGPRLIACAEAAVAVEGRSAHDIFGSPDDMKLRSCATLFAAVPGADPVFWALLDRFFGGERDPETLRILNDEAVD